MSYLRTQNNRLVVIGGTGFVGQHLSKRLLSKRKSEEITYAVHRNEPAWLAGSGMHCVTVDILNVDSLMQALSPGCVVLNLLRPDGQGWFEGAVGNIMHACKTIGVARYVHVSSIDVFGAATDMELSSSTPALPSTPYEREHAKGEATVLACQADLEVVIVRLGAVFGVGGLNVVSLFHEVSTAPLWRLVLRRAFYGKRRMHLVSVDHVTQVLDWVVGAEGICSGEILLVTDDDQASNNFAYVQEALLRQLGRRSLDYVPHLPSQALEYLLKSRGVSNSNPLRRLREHRLQELGQSSENCFENELDNYIAHLRQGQ